MVLQPLHHFNYLSDANHFMTKIWMAYNHWFQVPKDKFKEISTVGIKLEAAIAVMDDLVDNSVLRARIPTSHLVYGRSRTIYSSIFGTISALTKFDDPRVMDVFIAMGAKLCYGQAVEIYFAKNGICPTEDDYQKIVFNKTTSVLSLSLTVQQIFATRLKGVNFDLFLDRIGLFFQICNDYISLGSRKYAELKVFGDDITEGVFTFPMIHGIRARPEDHRLMDILKQRTSDYEVKVRFVKLLEEFGSLDYTLRSLKKLKSECVEEMKKIAVNLEMEKILDDALNYMEDVVM
ncbi:terpene synthase-like [Zophobas morio]|uniref:terpene synthase-like n=1 Tax=Zophobas morio TaxID=2755281 RepID=UPI0030831ABB